MVIPAGRSRKFMPRMTGTSRNISCLTALKCLLAVDKAATRKDKNRVSQSKTMSWPGRFVLLVTGAAVLGLMAAMMVRTLEIYGGETYARAGQDDVIEMHTPLPAGPRRFQ
jgi:hypothetical protein